MKRENYLFRTNTSWFRKGKNTTRHTTQETFDSDGEKFQIETHLFDFEKMVYGKKMEIFFIEKIRDERKFPEAKFDGRSENSPDYVTTTRTADCFPS